MRVPVGEVSDKTQRCAGHNVNKSVPFFRLKPRNIGIGMCMCMCMMNIISMSIGSNGIRRCLIAMCIYMGR